MISTLRLFIGLLLRKAAPSDLPTSPRLLAATVFALVALRGLFAGAFGEDPGAVLPRALFSGVLSLGWIYLLTRIHGKPERFLQTATAMFGVLLVAAPFDWPTWARAGGVSALLFFGGGIAGLAGLAGLVSRFAKKQLGIWGLCIKQYLEGTINY